jgi:hydroxyacylglutathione hydrolase
VFFEQIIRQDIGCASYVVGSTDAGLAAVVDPRIDMVDEILEIASREGLTIRYIIETHNHADHVSGHHRLSELTGAEIAVHREAGAEYPHIDLEDGQELALGEVRLKILHTPGHRPEHIAVAAIDSTRGDKPWLVLTGDSLFIGDVARPDLAIDGKDGATALFQSLHDKLLQLPEGTMVFPGHVAGSLCGRVNNRMTGTTIGFERTFNPALTISDQTEFVRYMNESLPERPPNMARIVRLNMADEELRPVALRQLSVDDVGTHQADGAFVLDVHSPGAFASAHIPGSINVDLDGGQFQNRVGLVFPPGARLVLVADSDQEAHRAADALLVIGFTDIDGYVTGGMKRWEQAGHDYDSTTEITVHDLRERINAAAGLTVLDVRERSEWQEGHIESSENVPFYKVGDAATTLDPEQSYAVICGSGIRSMIAASILQAHGFRSILNVEGGMEAWNSAKFPTVQNKQPAGVGGS